MFNLFLTTTGSGVPSKPLPVICAMCALKSVMIAWGEPSPILPASFTLAPLEIAWSNHSFLNLVNSLVRLLTVTLEEALTASDNLL